jgi:23S rRNA pseudouridine1911/1915/1917 synthase
LASEPQGIAHFVVESEDAGLRLDVFLTKFAAGLSRSKVQQLIAAGAVTVDGEVARARDVTVAGSEVQVSWGQPPVTSPLEPVAMNLAILFEDEHMLVINKPAGLTVHPGAGETGPTLVQGLLHHCQQLSSGDGIDAMRPGIVHRLDKDTTGVMVCAKTDRAHAALAKQFQDKESLVREYQALLDGMMGQDEIVYSSYIHRDPVNRLRMASMTEAQYSLLPERKRPARLRLAKSRFSRDAVFGQRLTLARVRLYTGRTHQIRVHAKALGLAVVGDPLYNRPLQLPLVFSPEIRSQVSNISRQMLHAQRLDLKHPVSGTQLSFRADIPADFLGLLEALAPFRWDLR